MSTGNSTTDVRSSPEKQERKEKKKKEKKKKIENTTSEDLTAEKKYQSSPRWCIQPLEVLGSNLSAWILGHGGCKSETRGNAFQATLIEKKTANQPT